MEGRQIERLGAAGPPESADAKNGPDQQDTDPGRSQSAENPASGFKSYGKQLVLARGGFTLPKHTKSPGAPIKIITPKGVVIFCFRVNYTKGGYFYPPLGGASRAPGLPQAAAWRICGRGPHPLCAALPACSSTRRAGRREPLSRPCGPCVPVSEWRWAVTRRGTWTALGRVWGGDCPDHPNSEKERLLGPQFWALWRRSILVLG